MRWLVAVKMVKYSEGGLYIHVCGLQVCTAVVVSLWFLRKVAAAVAVTAVPLVLRPYQ